MSNLPGYQLFKDTTTRFAGMEDPDGSKVGLIAEEQGWRLCLVVESLDDWMTVYMPDGGTAGGTAGEVRLLQAREVIITELSWLTMAAGLRRGGRGMLEQMQPWLPKT